MTDREFDLLLEEGLTDLPPNDALVTEITPWRRAANRILLGTALSSITLHFLLLNYILPTIGLVLILLGFRSLRRENGWFRLGYATTIVRMVISILNIIFNATIWGPAFQSATDWMVFIGVPLAILHALCIWGGFRAVQIKAGVTQPSGGFWLVIFFVVMTVLGAAQFQSALVILVLLVLYILLLRSLWKYAALLDDAGYAVQAAPVRLSDRALTILLTAVIGVGVLCGYIFCGQYPMTWTAQKDISAQAEEVKARLLRLGFPGYVLDDLTQEEILACQGADFVYAETNAESFRTDHYTYYSMYYPDGELLVTHVIVRPENEADNWLIFEHFLWQAAPLYRGTDTVQVWPAYMRSDGWDKGGRLSGRVLHNRDGITFTAPYYDLQEKTYTTSNFFGLYETTDILASFSLPYGGENCRGYVCYDIQMAEAGWSIISWCNYSHQWFPVYPQLPSQDFVEGSYSLQDCGYKTRQTELSIRPSEMVTGFEPEE